MEEFNITSNDDIDSIIKSNNQEKLVELAKNSSDWHIRRDAVSFIDDEEILKDILNTDLVSAVCIKAAERIDGTEFLQDTCLNSPDSHLRLATLNRLYDEALLDSDGLNLLLEKIALNDPEEFVKQSACEKIGSDNQESLIKIAKCSDDEMLKGRAIRKITDESILADFAVNDSNEHVRLEAIQNPNLTNSKVLTRIISHEENEFNRLMAIYKIFDKDMLISIVFEKSVEQYIDEIAGNVAFNCEDYFLDIFENDSDGYKRRIAVSFIENNEILKNVVLNESDDKIRLNAIKNKNFSNQRVLENLLKTESNFDILYEVVGKIENEGILIDYVKNNLEYNKRTVRAISQLSDVEFLGELYDNDDSRMRLEVVKAISKMDNGEDILKSFVSRENDEEVLLEIVDSMNRNENLIEVAQNSDKDIKLAALNRVTPKRLLNSFFGIDASASSYYTTLNKIALYDEDCEVRAIAASKIEDKFILDNLLLHDECEDVKSAAQKRLDELFDDIKLINKESLLMKLISCGDSDVSYIAQLTLDDLKTWKSRIAKINDITDIETLKDICSNDFNYYVRCEAEGKLEKLLFNIRLDEISKKSNQNHFKNIIDDKSFTLDIRKKAILYILDAEFLKCIFYNDSDDDIRRVAQKRLNKLNNV